MQKRLLFISLIFSFVAMSCLVCSVALAQEGDAPLEGDSSLEGEGSPVDTPPPLDENGMVVEELMTDISEDMAEVLNVAAEQAFAEEERLDELKMDEMIGYEDLDVTGDARILPDSFLYPFKNLGRGIDTFFTFDPVKKVEKELDYANKKIMESHQLVEEKLVEEKVITEKVAKSVEKAIISAGKDLEDIADMAEKLKEARVENTEDAPKVEEFLDKVVDHTLKQQKVIEKLEEKLPEKALAKVVEAKEKALKHFGETMAKVAEKHEEITERITKVMNEQKGSDLKDLKNLEILEIIKEKIPEEAREAIEHVQENRIMVFQEKFKEMPEEVRAEKVDRYLGDMRGNALRQFDMLDDMKRSAWVDEDLIKELDLLKDKMVKKFETKFAGFEETVMRDQFMGHLMDGDPDDFRTLEQIDMRMGPMDMGPPPELEGVCFDPYDCEQYCVANPDVPGCEFMMHDFGPPPEIREAMQRVHDESVNRFKDRFAGNPEAMKNSEAIQRALENPDAIDFQLLDMVYETMPEDQKRFADELRRDVENKMIDMMSMAPMGPPPFMDFGPEGPPPGFMPPPPHFMMDRFIDPNAGSMEMLARLRDRMPEEDKFYMEQAMNEQVYRMDEHMHRMDDQEMFDRMKYQMQEDITVRHEIERRDENFFGDIDRRRMELEREMMILEEEKMRRMDDMKMEMMRGQREFMPMMGPQPMMMQMGPPPEEMMRMFEEQQHMFQDKMKEHGIDPCDFNNDGRVDEYESSQCMMGQQIAPSPDQGFFGKMREFVPFGDDGSQFIDPCDFNNDGYVDLYESKQCAEMEPMMPQSVEDQGFFDRMRDIVPFAPDREVTPQGEQCGDFQCMSDAYCANPSIGFCCPHGTEFRAPDECVGGGFFDKFRDFVPFVPDSGPQCGEHLCSGDSYCANPATGFCCKHGTTFRAPNECIGAEQEPWQEPTDTWCGSRLCSESEFCADPNRSLCCPWESTYNTETGQCEGGIEPKTVEGWCGDGVCEPNEYCPQDCETTQAHGCMGYNNGDECRHQGCVWCPEEGGCFVPGHSCSHMTQCNNNGVCDWNENMSTCPSDCGGDENFIDYPTCTSFKAIGEYCDPIKGICCSGMCSNMYGPGVCEGMSGGCQCSWGWSDNCNCGDETIDCDYDGYCDPNETMSSCPADCGGAVSCPENSYTLSDGGCNHTNCPDGCIYDSNGCPNGCIVGGTCGDGLCSNTENESNCPSDCGDGMMECNNDGICDWNETMESCPADCESAMIGCGSYTDSSSCASQSDCVWCEGESVPYSCFGLGHVCDETDAGCQCSCGWSDTCDCASMCPGGTNCDFDGVCEWDESLLYCPADCGEDCDYDGTCDSGETSTTCPSDCEITSGDTGGVWCSNTQCASGEMCCGTGDAAYCAISCGDDSGDWTECISYGVVGDPCDTSVGSCCSPGMCSNMNGPGICESDSSSGGGCQCDWGWSEDCMCGDSSSGGGGGCQCDWGWSDICDCGTSSGGGGGGCQCDWGWSEDCMCGDSSGSSGGGCECWDGSWSPDCMCPSDSGGSGGDEGDMMGCDCGDGTMSETCCGPMMRGEYPTQSWLRRVFTFIFGF